MLMLTAAFPEQRKVMRNIGWHLPKTLEQVLCNTNYRSMQFYNTRQIFNLEIHERHSRSMIGRKTMYYLIYEVQIYESWSWINHTQSSAGPRIKGAGSICQVFINLVNAVQEEFNLLGTDSQIVITSCLCCAVNADLVYAESNLGIP